MAKGALRPEDAAVSPINPNIPPKSFDKPIEKGVEVESRVGPQY